MDLALSYDPSVLQATEVIKGNLTANCMFDSSIKPGTVRIGLADQQGFSGEGSVGYVIFKVVGVEGASSPLLITDVSANRPVDFASVNIFKQDGVFTVVGIDKLRGDCNGDGRISALDALCALQMAVGKRTEDLAMDVSGDGKVSSLDAGKILQTAIRPVEVESQLDTMLPVTLGKILQTAIRPVEVSAPTPAPPAPVTSPNPLDECRVAEETITVPNPAGELVFLFQIKGESGGNCRVCEKVVEDRTWYVWEGKEMCCSIPMGALSGGTLLSDNIKDYCTGSLADAIETMLREAQK